MNPFELDPDVPLTGAEKLLYEWFQQWWRRDDMPAKMDEALHVRTSMYFIQKQHGHERSG